MTLITFIVAIAAYVLSSWRWIRVAQREHYLPNSCIRIARIWLRARELNAVLALLVIGLLVLLFTPLPAVTRATLGIVTAVAASSWPVWLPIHRTSRPLRWTRRARTLAVIHLALSLFLGSVATLLIPWWLSSVMVAAIAVGIVELALRVSAPVEQRIALRFQRLAEQRLRAVSPRVVAVTGSWGKTSTKFHMRDLAKDSLAVTTSPASFNNRAGLSRTMNEHLAEGTELLIVEMGMYGPGEIRDLCDWVRPEIGVITSVGPMHLERAGSLEAIAEAKAELVERTRAAVLWVEDPALRDLAERLRDGQRVWACGWRTTANTDVGVELREGATHVYVDGAEIGATQPGCGAHPSNVACAVAALLACGLPTTRIGAALANIDVPAHRGSAMTSDGGVTVLDDTFNSNPRGAETALAQLGTFTDSRRVVVTPGMFELGHLQDIENAKFARNVIGSGAELIAVGRTNRKALVRGANEAGGTVTCMSSRSEAVAWLRSQLRAGDAVLWENDLPDHYP